MTAINYQIKGLAITPSILGRISIGHREERNGKVLPVRDDVIHITSAVRRGIEWVAHPLETELLTKQNAEQQPAPNNPDENQPVNETKEKAKSSAINKLRSIPVTLLFNNPELNIQANYSAFESTTGRQVCVGDGTKARRFSHQDNKTNEVDCNGPQHCEFGKTWRCKLHAKVNVQIEGQEDPMGVFVFRTAGYNSVRTLIYKLQGYYSLFKGNLRGIPFNLVIRAKSTTQSMGQPVFYLDLVLRNMTTLQAMQKGKETADADAEAGMDQKAFEDAMLQGLKNSAFSETEEDGMDILDEFVTDDEIGSEAQKTGQANSTGGLAALARVLPDNDKQKNSGAKTTKQSGTLPQNTDQTGSPEQSGVNEAALSSFQLPPNLQEQFNGQQTVN